jgi:hypothetical protein
MLSDQHVDFASCHSGARHARASAACDEGGGIVQRDWIAKGSPAPTFGLQAGESP